MIASSRNYAIGMVHFLIGGGWKLMTIVLTVYLCLFGAGVAMFYYAQYVMFRDDFGGGRGGLSDLAHVILVLLMGIQGMVLLLVGGYRVSSAIRTDISSRMLESHRLMPVSSSNAVWGYLFGPTTPVTVFALLNLTLSCAFGALQGAAVGRLLINQAVIFAFAVFVWSLIALGTFIYRHMFFIALAGIFLGSCTTLIFYALILFPGLGLVLTPFLGETVFGVGAPVTDAFDEGYAFGAAGQAALFIIFFFGACRLYRGAYRVVFTEFQAVALLAVWAILSAIGLWYSDRIGIQHLLGSSTEFDEDLGTAQIVASVASCIILAFIPFWSFLQEDRRRATNPALRLGSIVAVALLAALPPCGAVWMKTFNVSNIAWTLLIVGAQIVIAYGVLRAVRRLHFLLAAVIAGAVLLLLWIGPLVLELGRVMIWDRGLDREQNLSVLGTLSPLGYLAALWNGNRSVSLVPGTVVQLASALLIVTVAFFIIRRKERTVAPVVPPVMSPARLPAPGDPG
jgi:hypothetical protein